jgi:hypothetical protein
MDSITRSQNGFCHPNRDSAVERSRCAAACQLADPSGRSSKCGTSGVRSIHRCKPFSLPGQRAREFWRSERAHTPCITCTPDDPSPNRERGGEGGKREKGRDYWPELRKPRRLLARGFALTAWTAFSAANCLAPQRQSSSELSPALSVLTEPGSAGRGLLLCKGKAVSFSRLLNGRLSARYICGRRGFAALRP